MRKNFILIFLVLATTVANAQWTTSGTTIYNSNTGNVGIGTTGPTAKLDVRNSIDGQFIGLRIANINPGSSNHPTSVLSLSTGATANDLAQLSGYQEVIGSGSNGSLQFFTRLSDVMNERMRITSNGNVGIGTTAPWSRLDVRTAGASGGDQNALNIQNPSTAAYAAVQLSLATGPSSSSLVYAQRNNTGNGSSLLFWNTDANAVLQPRMTINSVGNVGINTNNPLEKLQIGDRFIFQDGGWKAIGYNITWDATNSINSRIVAAPSSGIFLTDLGNIVFQNAPTGAAGSDLTNMITTMVIHNSGQVGIGTSPTAATFQDQTTKLFVVGGVRAQKVVVDQQTWSDYVFQNGYHLLPLADLQKYIEENKHLPDVPSANEVQTNGLNVGENQATLLKKIEELTLYVIEQNKMIEQLNNRNKELETKQQTLENETLQRLEKKIKDLEVAMKAKNQ
ncbi:MAG: hypothetical protein JST87_18625 [Bacteroidetes bacterium]|nr:hypothetical protein [Bacteroidota bacterium]